jgi:hypothetical protein
MSESDIRAFIHCTRCVKQKIKPDIEVGLVAPTILRVWCRVHDVPIGDFDLAAPMPGVRCSVCGHDLIEGTHTHDDDAEDWRSSREGRDE